MERADAAVLRLPVGENVEAVRPQCSDAAGGNWSFLKVSS